MKSKGEMTGDRLAYVVSTAVVGNAGRGVKWDREAKLSVS